MERITEADTAGARTLVDWAPNLFVIGATKSGTTLFHDLLDQHPEIFMSKPKELWHFNREDHSARVTSYLSFFEEGRGVPIRGESTPIYAEAVTFPHVAPAIHQFSPDAKIVYLVREPFSRFRSQWIQTLDSGHWYRKSFYPEKMPTSYRESVFKHPPYLLASLYWTNISSFRKHFPDSQIKVILFEDFINFPVETMQSVFAFLGVLSDWRVTPHSGNQNSKEGKSIYSPFVSWFRRAVPSTVRERVSSDLRLKVRGRIIGLTAPEFDHADLSPAEKAEIRRRLQPEVKALYEYLGLQGDPWDIVINPSSSPSSSGGD